MGCAAPNPLHWEDLRSHPREQILRHESVKSSQDDSAYEVTFLNATYLVDAQNERIVELSPEPGRLLSESFQILIIRYLISEYHGPATGESVSEKDLTGGVTFFQGPHTLQVAPIAQRFGSDPDGFQALAESLGAAKIDYGDCGMKFLPFPNIPVTYVLWVEDEEFPASVSVLFDSSIEQRFALDMVFTLVMSVTEHVMRYGDPE